MSGICERNGSLSKKEKGFLLHVFPILLFFPTFPLFYLSLIVSCCFSFPFSPLSPSFSSFISSLSYLAFPSLLHSSFFLSHSFLITFSSSLFFQLRPSYPSNLLIPFPLFCFDSHLFFSFEILTFCCFFFCPSTASLIHTQKNFVLLLSVSTEACTETLRICVKATACHR